MDMSVNIAGVEWKNPVTVASGTFGSGAEFADYVDINKLGAVTTKGVADVPWAGIRLLVWQRFTVGAEYEPLSVDVNLSNT